MSSVARTRSSAAAPNSRRRTGSRRSSTSAAASASGSSGGTSTPASPSCAGIPPIAVPTTARPSAIASGTTRGDGSTRDAMVKTSDPARAGATCGTSPTNSTMSSTPSDRASATYSSSGRPTHRKRTSRSGATARTRAATRTQTSAPFRASATRASRNEQRVLVVATVPIGAVERRTRRGPDRLDVGGGRDHSHLVGGHAGDSQEVCGGGGGAADQRDPRVQAVEVVAGQRGRGERLELVDVEHHGYTLRERWPHVAGRLHGVDPDDVGAVTAEHPGRRGLLQPRRDPRTGIAIAQRHAEMPQRLHDEAVGCGGEVGAQWPVPTQHGGDRTAVVAQRPGDLDCDLRRAGAGGLVRDEEYARSGARRQDRHATAAAPYSSGDDRAGPLRRRCPQPGRLRER